MGENMNTYRILLGMPEGKSPLRRPCRWVDNIIILKWNLGKLDEVVWTGLM
jgi:hypothetical protein